MWLSVWSEVQIACGPADALYSKNPFLASFKSRLVLPFWYRLPTGVIVSNKCIAVHKVATPLRELTCHVGSHSVNCHPTEVIFPPLPQPKLVLDSSSW